MLQHIAAEERTVILYESPHRLVRTLTDLATWCGPERQAAVCRELTKLFEETRRAALNELKAHYEAHPPKGEIVLLIAGKDSRADKRSDNQL